MDYASIVICAARLFAMAFVPSWETAPTQASKLVVRITIGRGSPVFHGNFSCRDIGHRKRTAIQMNPYKSQPLNPIAHPADAVRQGGIRRFRWSTIPAALSGFFGLLALVAIPIGIFQNIEVY